MSRAHQSAARSPTSRPRMVRSLSAEGTARRFRSVQLASIRIVSLICVDRASSCPCLRTDRRRRVLCEVAGLSGGDAITFDLRENAVIMDALIVPRMYAKPRNARILVETLGGVPDYVFDENRIVIGLHREPSFI